MPRLVERTHSQALHDTNTAYTRCVDDKARIAELERENAELRALVPAVEDVQRRQTVSRLMMAGGLVALLTGVVGASWYAVICGVGWVFGGAAVASTIQRRQ